MTRLVVSVERVLADLLDHVEAMGLDGPPAAAARAALGRPCLACRSHYGDVGICDRGLPAASPHRRVTP